MPDAPLDADAPDFFRGGDLIEDPYPYYERLRRRCPVTREPHQDVVMVTGYDEAIAVYNDTDRFSSCISVTGPFPGFPVPLTGDDLSDLIEAHRDELPFSDQLPTFDPPKHTDHRALLSRLITPKRLKENEDFMWRLADRQLDDALGHDDLEFVADYGAPFAMLVVADLLGVPESDHEQFRDHLAGGRRSRTGTVGGLGGSDTLAHNPLEFLYERFSAYITERRREPAGDVLTGLAAATFPDGTLPEVIDVVRIAANLFAAGQETTVRLLSGMLQLLGDRPELEAWLREDRTRIPNFVEETLRVESPVKGDFRLSRVPVTVGGIDLAAGTTVMVLNGAAGRDPRHFDDPARFDPERADARRHLAFGHGAHTCPGAPLARAEARVTLERLLDRTTAIRISEAHHGPPGDRHFDYVPTFILRGLRRLHLDVELAGSPS